MVNGQEVTKNKPHFCGLREQLGCEEKVTSLRMQLDTAGGAFFEATVRRRNEQDWLKQ